MTLGLVYGYDRYRVDDFALDSEILNRIDMTAGVLLLANAYQPYRASTFVMRMTYVW